MSSYRKISIGTIYYVAIVLIPVALLVVCLFDYVKNEAPLIEKFFNDHAAIQLLKGFYEYSDKSLCQNNVVNIDLKNICVVNEYQDFRKVVERSCIDPFCKTKDLENLGVTAESTTRVFLFGNDGDILPQTISNYLVNISDGCFKSKKIILSWCLK